ncbi:5'/3'-nucleotidase SurE [Candidatus Margulisiibacteriota bacterium]
MKILLTNDDGINSPGLRALVLELSKIAELFVLAPDRQRSLVSHSLTLNKPLKVTERRGLFEKNISAFELNGMPADCVKVGIRELMDTKPDLVIAGINEEPNLGTDVVYSGTVSAAREAVLEGIPSIAVSISNKQPNTDFSYAAGFIREFIGFLKENYWQKEMLLNVNIPNKKNKFTLNEFRITKLGERKYIKLLEKKNDENGEEYYLMSGELVDEEKNDQDADVCCVLEGKVSVTPLQYDYTHHEEIAEMKEKLLKVRSKK